VELLVRGKQFHLWAKCGPHTSPATEIASLPALATQYTFKNCCIG